MQSDLDAQTKDESINESSTDHNILLNEQSEETPSEAPKKFDKELISKILDYITLSLDKK